MSTDTGTRPRGEGGTRGGGKSWAELLGSSLPPSLNKNVLEVLFEKEQKGFFQVNEIDCARMLKKLGLDPLHGAPVQLEEV